MNAHDGAPDILRLRLLYSRMAIILVPNAEGKFTFCFGPPPGLTELRSRMFFVLVLHVFVLSLFSFELMLNCFLSLPSVSIR